MAQTPEWIESAGDFFQFVMDAHAQSVNASSVGAGGRGIHVGIFDSCYSHPHEPFPDAKVRHNRRFVNSSEDLTTPHGARVSDMAVNFSPFVTLSFYQVINKEGDMPIEAFSDGVSAAIEDQVDIVNISAGAPWQGPIDLHLYVKEARRLIAEGTTVVAAAGNDYQQSSLPVHSPALDDDIIAVGGCVTKCPSSIDESHTTPCQGPYYTRAESDDGNQIDAAGVYCGWQGCSSQECLSRNSDRAWV
jgi:subtilisin family serine protease